MSRRAAVVLLLCIAVLVMGGAFAWLHLRGQQPVVAFTPEAKAGDASRSAAPSPAASPASPPSLSPNAASTEKLAAKPVAGMPPAEPSFVPKVGETLDFSAAVAKVNDVANLQLEVDGQSQLDGKETWHLRADAHTKNPLRMIFPLDDQFDSYSDTGSFTCLQYEMRLNERGQKEDSIQRMSATGKEPTPTGVTIARVLPGTRDPLGMMEYLRSVDWSSTREVRSPVYDGRKLYEVRAERTRTAEVTVTAGRFRTTVIEIRVFENGVEQSDARFTLYLAKDVGRTPVLLEAVMPFATARVELIKRAE
jgi:hypothetical protein